MTDNHILDMCEIITSHPRDVFLKNMSGLVGEKFNNYVLTGCELNRTNDMVSLYLRDEDGLVHTFVGYVYRHEMDYNPSQLKYHFGLRIERAFSRRSA